MTDDKSQDTGYDLSDGEWLSYAELAERRGIDRQSAFKLAARHRWRRQKGNTGHVRVFVPSAFAEPEDKGSDAGYDLSHHLAAFEAAMTTIREAHAGEVKALREQLSTARSDADMSQDRAIRAEDRAEAAEGRASQAQAAAAEARQRLEALEATDRARQARGLLARLKAAVRGE